MSDRSTMSDAHYRIAPYAVVNLAFGVLVIVGSLFTSYPDPRSIYLVLLFGLCSSAIVDMDGFNGRYFLNALFLLVYFISFGALDLANVLTGGNTNGPPIAPSGTSMLLPVEEVVLTGGLMFIAGYRAVVRALGWGPRARSAFEWTRPSTITVGLLLWVIGTIATYQWNVYIVPDTTNEAVRRGLASQGELEVSAYLVGQMCQPLGILLLGYAWTVRRNLVLDVFIVVMIVLQIIIGFIVDIKGLAMLGIILVFVATTLVSGRLPKIGILVGLLFVVFIYPYFTAYRTAIHGAGITRAAVVQNFGQILEKTIEAKDEVNRGRERPMTFLERSSVKDNVAIIVNRAGRDVAFQSGHTLAPILQSFFPKLLWSEKVRVPTGQLFNRQFHLTDSENVYISPSHLGELYWNFGWSGVLIGMSMIGAICGWVGARFNMAAYRTVTRLLVTVVTIKQLIVAFESSIADCYVVWLRSLVGVGLLHLAFARRPVTPSAADQPEAGIPLRSKARSQVERLFPNLLT